MKPPVLEVKNIKKYFPMGGGLFSRGKKVLKAVDGVSLTVRAGETFGLVGESGCGKSTLGRLMLRLIDPTGGNIFFRGEDITRLSKQRMRPLRKKMQIIFQDPYSSLDPRMSTASVVTEPLRAFQRFSQKKMREEAARLLETVGLSPEDMDKRPHEFSGGQRQRIGIARALSPNPELIIADEPVSALDVSIQAQVLNLLNHLKKEHRLSYVFISHNLSVVERMCDRIAVMYMGRIVESAPASVFFHDRKHPYSKMLLRAVPIPDPRRRSLPDPSNIAAPNPLYLPPGCPFHPRCPHSGSLCRKHAPSFTHLSGEHGVACWGVY